MSTKFLLKPLRFSYDALEPYIDQETVRFHHDKHQQTYTDNLNKALSNYPKFYEYSLEKILKNLSEIPEDVRQSVTNNAGGVYNHEFYWDGIIPSNSVGPIGTLKSAINKTFDSYDNLKEKLIEASLTRFGSGWGWLVLDENKKLLVLSTANQDCPLSNNQTPLLTIDVWEHAYYLKYQNRRAEYLDNFFNLINWEKIEERYVAAMLKL